MKITLSFVIGSVMGLLSAILLSGLAGPGLQRWLKSVDVAGWNTDPAIGSSSANSYIRAFVARRGLLALSKSEATYFTRNVDDSGERLHEECTYRISGSGFPGRWWSITLYDADSRLPDNSDGALSIGATKVGGTQHWSAIIAPLKPLGEEHWISSHNAGQFDLTLRIYRPSSALQSSPQKAFNPPSIKKLTCAERKAS
jgi:hypothetical protein